MCIKTKIILYTYITILNFVHFIIATTVKNKLIKNYNLCKKNWPIGYKVISHAPNNYK